jgi:hypothetical protein
MENQISPIGRRILARRGLGAMMITVCTISNDFEPLKLRKKEVKTARQAPTPVVIVAGLGKGDEFKLCVGAKTRVCICCHVSLETKAASRREGRDG